jgi:hypothetical protein
MVDEPENLQRLEFDHFIAEFEAFRDTMLDQITSLKHELELIAEKIDDIKRDSLSDSKSQSKLL